MRTISIATSVLGLVATMLATVGTTVAAPGYDARARLSDHPRCLRTPTAGITRRSVVLDNTRSAHRVQYKLVRDGDRFADPVVYVWVPAHRRKTVMVSVPERTTASVRVRVPEMGRHNLLLSATVAARASCHVETVEPKASLGGVACQGRDSVARIVLDNRGTSDKRIAYTLDSSYADSSASLTVAPASSTNYYLPVPAGGSTHVTVTAGGHRVLSADVAAVSCP